jgi:hypothetical protein
MPKGGSLLHADSQSAEFGKIILNSLKGYYSHALSDIFPQDQSETYAWREINKRYFDR